MSSLRATWLLIAFPVLAFAGCEMMGRGGGEEPSDLTISEVDCGSMTADASVDIVDGGFEPMEVYVRDGGIVMWTNMGDKDHTVTSGSPDRDDAGMLFDSGTLKPGDMYCASVKGMGNATYFCRNHPEQMRDAMIEVSAKGEQPGGEQPGAGGGRQ